MQKISELRKSLHNDHEDKMCELLDKLDVKSKKLKKLENQMCSLEELDELRETEKSHKRLMQSHENIIKVFMSFFGEHPSHILINLVNIDSEADN